MTPDNIYPLAIARRLGYDLAAFAVCVSTGFFLNVGGVGAFLPEPYLFGVCFLVRANILVLGVNLLDAICALPRLCFASSAGPSSCATRVFSPVRGAPLAAA